MLSAGSREDSFLMLGYSWTHKTSWADVLGSPAEALLFPALCSVSIFIIIIVLLYYLFYITDLLVFPIGMLKNEHI